MSGWRFFFLPALAGSFISCSGTNHYRKADSVDSQFIRRGASLVLTDAPGAKNAFEFSSIVAEDKSVYVGSRTQGVFAFYPGFIKRKFEFNEGGGVVSEITLDHDYLYFAAVNGLFYKISATTGKKEWSTELKTPFVSKATINTGKVFVLSAGDVLSALDQSSGKIVWQYRKKSSVELPIRTLSQPQVDNFEVLVGFSDGSISAFGLDDGSVRWEKFVGNGGRFTDVDSSVISTRNFYIVSVYDGSIKALRKTDREVLWTGEWGGSRTPTLIGEDHILIPSTRGTVTLVQLGTWNKIWEFELDRGSPTQILKLDNYLAFGSTYQYLYVLDAQTGKLVYRFNAGYGSGFSTTPTLNLNKDGFFILSMAGRLYEFVENKPKVPLKILKR